MNTADRPTAAPQAPPARWGAALYGVLWVLCRTLAIAALGFRVRFAAAPPRTGGLLVLSSHQSHLDPLLLGLAMSRRLSSLARSSLFQFGPFGAVISALDAVPIDRGTSTVQQMKTVIRKLQAGAAVIVFPEGTRTADGHLGELKGGFALIARRSGVPLLPVAIVGAYECWPRSRFFPRPGRIRLEFGPVITAAEVAATDDRQLTARVSEELARLDTQGRAARDGRGPRQLTRTPAHGPA
jgi:1-acyl-sn-glycerol-3-phosphate acyltransferase